MPGFVLGLMMMLMAYFLARRAGFTGTVDEDKVPFLAHVPQIS